MPQRIPLCQMLVDALLFLLQGGPTLGVQKMEPADKSPIRTVGGEYWRCDTHPFSDLALVTYQKRITETVFLAGHVAGLLLQKGSS